MTKITKAVIPAGGLATRFLPMSKAVAKEMFPIVDKPVLQYLIEELSQNGIKDILIILNKDKECVVNHFDESPKLYKTLLSDNKLDLLTRAKSPTKLANITYIRSSEQKGVARALLKTKKFINNEPFVLLFGDELLLNNEDDATKQMLKVFNKTNKNVISAINVDKSQVSKYGILDIDKNNNVISIIEKPIIELAPSTLAATGKYILKPEILTHIKSINKHHYNKENNFSESLQELANQNDLVSCELKGERFDTGGKLGLLEANIAYGLADNEISSELKEYINSVVKTF